MSTVVDSLLIRGHQLQKKSVVAVVYFFLFQPITLQSFSI